MRPRSTCLIPSTSLTNLPENSPKSARTALCRISAQTASLRFPLSMTRTTSRSASRRSSFLHSMTKRFLRSRSTRISASTLSTRLLMLPWSMTTPRSSSIRPDVSSSADLTAMQVLPAARSSSIPMAVSAVTAAEHSPARTARRLTVPQLTQRGMSQRTSWRLVMQTDLRFSFPMQSV